MHDSDKLRPCAVAGSFYSADKNELTAEVDTLLKNAKKFSKENIRAIIVPHAGYVYSAPISANSFATLHKKYKNIFLLGSSHHVSFDGASVYNDGDYQTPIGEVIVNKDIVKELISASKFISYKPEAHIKEHTLEVQLPFLQEIYVDELQIVPIIMATSNLDTIISISKVLEPYFNEDNLFVISTDLSHYPSYKDANIVDKRTLDALVQNNPQLFINTLIQNEESQTPNLVTSACGWSSLLTLLYITQNKNFTYQLLDYKNSGDTKYGDKDRVVGYGAVRIYKNTQEFFLNDEEKKELLNIAKLSLYEATLHNTRAKIDESKISPKLRKNLGAFVTLHKNGQLRGCIGRFEPDQSLYSVIIDMAISAAQQDPRFTKVTKDELPDIDIEISVLTPRKKIHSLDEIVLGRDGIYIQKGARSGTFLPQVATDTGWSLEEFLGHCAQDKAGIGYNGYKDADIYTYQAIIFNEKEFSF